MKRTTRYSPAMTAAYIERIARLDDSFARGVEDEVEDRAYARSYRRQPKRWDDHEEEDT